MSSSNGYGFREVLIDQPFTGKWMEVDMNLGGGHSTFQGTKFSDFAGGFSYKTNGTSGKQIIQNRCIYWRTLNDTLELTEMSMDYNLVDNQVRYIFQDSPIVGPITIQETESNVVILVATVTSVNRFIFTHPKRIQDMPPDKNFTGGIKPSIFFQVCNKPQMNFRSFNLYEHAINIPVPLSAACYYVERGPSYNQNLNLNTSVGNGECFFAFSFETGSIHVYKISRDETLQMYDLRQANRFARFLSGFTPSILKGSNSSTDAVIGLSFFVVKGDRNKSIQLTTLSMNGQLNLWLCSNLDAFSEWTSYHCGVVDGRFAIDGFTDSSMLLRKNQDHDPANELPIFVVYIPGNGFKTYRVLKNVTPGGGNLGGSGSTASKFVLQESQKIDFKERDLMDFSVTSEYLFLLVNNPEEETEWEIKSYRLNDFLNPRFNLALLEPLPYPDVEVFPPSAEPKEFYMDLVFSRSSFSAQTVTKALAMFRKDEDEAIKDKDWDSLRITTMNMIDREISLATSNSDYDISDDDYSELCLRHWLMFYNSCVEYHIHTVKPLGLFYESNTKMVCVIKKSRISFLRPTDLLETLYYFPHCVALSDTIDAGDDRRCQLSMIMKYLDVIETIESTLEDRHKLKLEKRLRENHATFEEACTEVATVLTEADPHCLVLEQRHFIPMLGSKLKELGELGDQAMNLTISLISTWEGESDNLNPQDDDEMDTAEAHVSESFMASRLGAHLTFKILRQLMDHRFMIARDSMLLQSLIVRCFSQNNEVEGIHMLLSWGDRLNALCATTNYFALLFMSEDNVEPCRPFVKERGLKVANILKIYTADHLSSENFQDALWPMKVMESFCLSQIGGLAIRSRVSSSKTSRILAYAEAAGRAIWVNEMTVSDHPFEDFLIVSCQYSLLLKYANYLISYLTSAKTATKKFYLGIATLFLEEPDLALADFRSISLKEAMDDPFFCIKILEVPPLTLESEFPASAYTSYYVKIISIFQIFEQVSAVQQLAEDGLRVADNDNSATQMCSLAFKSALNLDDFSAAYKYIMLMPSYDASKQKQERKEKLASLRMFVSKILQKGEADVLISVDFSDMFNKTTTVREQVEQILFAQANLSDPLQQDGVYQMLYLYHLCRENFHKAAATMYYRAVRIGEKGDSLEALQAQRDSYLDVITCLSLVKQKNYRFVIQKTGIIPETLEPEICFDDSEVPVFTTEQSMVVRKYSDISRELELCVMLTKIADKFNPTPVKVFEFAKRAEQAVDCLTNNHYYDDAIKLATLWDISIVPVISAFCDVCCNLIYSVLPESEDPFDYIRNNDFSELPNSDTGVIDIAFRLLENYLKALEKPKESVLHEEIVLKFLAANIELPQWLIASYKKRNAAQLLRCYIRYGEWEESTQLAVKIIDASLGRRKCDEFDPSIKKISAYDAVEPVLPFTDINLLAGQMKARFEDDPQLRPLYDTLKTRTELFCDRVLQCTEEREGMFTDTNNRLQY